MKKETIVIILLCVLLVAEAAALVIQNRRYNALMAAYREAIAAKMRLFSYGDGMIIL